MKLNDKIISESTKNKICLLIKALREERSKYCKYFAAEFRCSQKSLVKRVKFIEQSNSFVALLQ
jgi:hypothetical protein